MTATEHATNNGTSVDPRAAGFARLREPFEPSQIGQLPKGNVKLDYVGHAAVTSRLLEVDPEWNWEPRAGWDENGEPKFIRDDKGRPIRLWINLTVLGMTRTGVGTVVPGCFDAEKQLIGDAIRNAAMRFGVALDLWIKGKEEEQAVQQSVAQDSSGAVTESGPVEPKTCPVCQRRTYRPDGMHDACAREVTEAQKAPDARWVAVPSGEEPF